MPLSDATPVDTVGERSVSFAPPSQDAPDPKARPAVPTTAADGRATVRIAVDAGVAGRNTGDAVSRYPIQLSKVQRPPLRDETLSRDRLLDWLNAKIHHRVVFVVAEAGYGKTTLLSDFSRRTRLRILWYRLDEEDRSWVPFINYLVAAGREHDPTFAEATTELLADTGGQEPTRDQVVDALVRDFRALGEHGAVVVFDDFHVVDDAPDIPEIVSELLARSPERVTFVFASRRQPAIRVARLRALGEVAELSTDELRFSDLETERLFRETYGRPLEPDVLEDLSRRTEGWAASLQLVRTAIRERSSGEARLFIRSMTGAEGHLYEYLAEEVVGDLDQELQQFLMTTSVLQSVNVDLAVAATGLPASPVRDTMARAEVLGLLGHGGSHGKKRYHPLVREFLRRRLERSRGPEGVTALHLAIAGEIETDDWRIASFHYASAGAGRELYRVLSNALPTILGTGAYALAASYVDQLPPQVGQSDFEVVRSRVLLRKGQVESARAAASRAHAASPSSDIALANLASVEFSSGQMEVAARLSEGLQARTDDPVLSAIAKASLSVIGALVDRSLTSVIEELEQLADLQSASGLFHYQGITLLNLAELRRASGDAPGTLRDATAAAALLSATSAGPELVTCRLLIAWALAHSRDWDSALASLAPPSELVTAPEKGEFLVGMAMLHALYGDVDTAVPLLNQASSNMTESDFADRWRVVAAETALRRGAIREASAHVGALQTERVVSVPAHRAHQFLLRARLDHASGRPFSQQLEAALLLSQRQGADFYVQQCLLLKAAEATKPEWENQVSATLSGTPVYATLMSDVVVSRLHELSDDSIEGLRDLGTKHPLPWRRVLRRAIDDRHPSELRAAALLEDLGDHEDLPRLRGIARANKPHSTLGRRLARKLANRVEVEDLGRVAVRLAGVKIPATTFRRKVMAMLCYLVARPDFAAARDQALDALWPELAPEVGLNSLNQTIYFLRRVFEPNYQEDLSPGYLSHASDMIWLDPELVTARAADCWRIIRDIGVHGSPEQVERLSAKYTGRFALDFAYEEWANQYRDSLHAAYLQVVETAVRQDTASGHFDRGIRLARRALEIDPGAEQLELSLLRLYRLTGAHAAAAEQYLHYAAVTRDELGVDPIPLDDI